MILWYNVFIMVLNKGVIGFGEKHGGKWKTKKPQKCGF